MSGERNGTTLQDGETGSQGKNIQDPDNNLRSLLSYIKRQLGHEIETISVFSLTLANWQGKGLSYGRGCSRSSQERRMINNDG